MPGTKDEIVEQMVAAWNLRDIDAILGLTASDALYVNAPTAVEPGTRRGHAEIAEVFRSQWTGLTSNAEQSIEQMVPLGDDLVSVVRVSLRLQGSEAAATNRVALRWSFHNGLITRLEVLGGGSELTPALEAVGITLKR